MASAPKIEYRHNAAKGRHEIGVTVDKVFVPFATVDDAVYDQRAENAANLAEAYEAENGGEEEAK